MAATPNKPNLQTDTGGAAGYKGTTKWTFVPPPPPSPEIAKMEREIAAALNARK
jgi:hypothetical protein